MPWYCGPAGGQVDVKIGLEGGQRSRNSSSSDAAQKRQKKEEGPVVWPDPPDPSTPGPDSRFGAGQWQGRGQAGASASLPLILPTYPRIFDLGIYTLDWGSDVTAAVVTCDCGWMVSPH